MTKMLPCPFCGSRAELGGYQSSWYIACTDEDCWARVHGSLWVEREEAIAAWNRRAPTEGESRLRERVKELEAALGSLPCYGCSRRIDDPEGGPGCVTCRRARAALSEKRAKQEGGK